jgi:hypothetical protein
MKHLKIFEEFKVGTLYTAKDEDSNTGQIEIDGYPVKIINAEGGHGCKFVYSSILVLKNGITTLENLCFSELDEVKNHISRMIKRYEKSNIDIDSFIVKKMILDLVDVKSEEDGEKPPKWVKNPKSWAMDKIVSLLTPENINQIANCYISSGIFDFKELDNLKSNMKAIYQSSKNKKESDVTDHIRRFGIKSIKGVHYLKGDKNKIAEKFENLLRYFQK